MIFFQHSIKSTILTDATHFANKKPFPFLVAARIWILTSVVLGTGCGVYFTAVEQEIAALFFLIIIGAAVCSLPVLLILTFVLEYIDDIPFQPVVKIRRLVLVCLGCVSPYGLILSSIYSNSYNNPHYYKKLSICFFVITAVLLVCSIAAILLSNKMLIRFFSATIENTYSIVEQLPAEDKK